MSVNIPIRWADNTEELKRNLAEGLDRIEATRAGADKLAQSLSGERMIAAAHRYVAAIEQIGGAERLNDQQRERSNIILDKAIAQLQVLGRVAPAAMVAFAEATSKAKGELDGLAAGMTAAGQAATASGKLIAGMSDAGRAAAQAQVDAQKQAADAAKALAEANKQAAEASKRAAEESAKAWTKMTNGLRGVAEGARTAGMMMTAAITVPIAAIGVAAFKAATEFETAFAGVEKTVKGTPPQLAAINTELREMAKIKPTTAVELAHIAETAGQLGVASENVVKFTETIADISAATHLTTEEAATSFAKLAVVTKMPQEQFRNLGSTVVALGNYGASTEQEMLNMGQRIASAGATAGMKTAQILGFANAFSSVGIGAEAGGTAISRVINRITMDVASGKGELETFAHVAGMSADAFAKAWRDNAGEAFTRFIEGMAQARARGGDDLLKLMHEIGLDVNVRTANSFLAIANAGDLARKSIDLATQSFEANTEVGRASEARYKTVANQLAIVKGQLNDVAITLGKAAQQAELDALRMTKPLIEGLDALAKGFQELPEAARFAALAFAGIFAAAGPVVWMLGSVAGAVLNLVKAWRDISVALEGVGLFSAVTSGLARVGESLGLVTIAADTAAVSVTGLGLALAGITAGVAFVALAYQLGQFAIKSGEARAEAEKWKVDKSIPPPIGAPGTRLKTLVEEDQQQKKKEGKDVEPLHLGTTLKLFEPDDQIVKDAQAWAKKTVAERTKALTAEQKKEILEKHAEGATPKTIAAESQFNTSEDVIKMFLKQQELAEAATRKTRHEQELYNEVVNEYASTAAPNYASILSTIGNTMYEGIVADQHRVFSTEKLARAYGTTVAVVDQVLRNERAMDEASRQQIKTEADLAKVIENRDAAEDASGEQGVQKKIERLALAREHEKTDWAERLALGTANQEQYDQAIAAIDATYRAKKDTLTSQQAQDEYKQYLVNEDRIEAMLDQRAAAEEKIGLRGLDLALANINKKQDADLNYWKILLDQGRVGAEQYQRAIDAIMLSGDQQRHKAEIAFEEQKWYDLAAVQRKGVTAANALHKESTAYKIALADQEYQAEREKYRKLGELDDQMEAALKQNHDEEIARIKELGDTWFGVLNDVAQMMRKLGDITSTQHKKFSEFQLGDWFDAVGKSVALAGSMDKKGGLLNQIIGTKQVPKLDQWGNETWDAITGARLMQEVPRAGGKFAPGGMFGMPKSRGGQMAFAGLQAGAGILQQATADASTRSGVALNYAAQGAQMGAVAGPWGMAIGAAAGFVAGLIKGKPAWARASDEISRDFGVKIGRETADAIAKDAKDLFHGDRWAAEYAHLADIIKDAGGLTTQNLDKMTGKLHDVFSLVEMGHFKIADATKVLDENFAQFAQAGTDAYGNLADSLKEIIRLNERFGTQSKAIADYLKGQGGAALTAWGSIAAGVLKDAIGGFDALKKAVDDAREAQEKALKAGDARGAAAAGKQLRDAVEAQTQAGARAQTGLASLGVQAVATFTAAVAAGMSEADALKEIGGSLDTLEQAYTDLGLSVDDVALKALFFKNDLLKAAPQLVGGVAALSGEMAALANMGLLNAQSFEAMEKTGADMYTQLQAHVAAMGGTTKDALLPMQDYLHEAALKAAELHEPLDETTQLLIDQSKELGIWKEKGKSATEKMTESMGKLVDKVDDLVQALLGLPPHVHTDVDVDVHTSTDGGDGAPPPATAATGGLVTGGGVRYLSGGGMAAHLLGDSAFGAMAALDSGRLVPYVPQGTDTVPAMLTPGEGVLTTRGMKALGPQGLALLNAGDVDHLITSAIGNASVFPGDLLDTVDQAISIGGDTSWPMENVGEDSTRKGDTSVDATVNNLKVEFEIHTLDASDFQAVVEQKVFPALVNQLRRGRGLTQMQDVLQVR